MSIRYDTIFALGPAGTFSDEAAQKVSDSQSKIVYTRTFIETLTQLEDHSGVVAVVPVENSVAGIVAQVQELLVTEDLVIQGEINIQVRYALLANVPLEEVETHYAHAQAAEQINNFALQNLPNSSVQFSQSNVASCVQFLNAAEQDLPTASVVPLHYAERHPTFLKAEDIQDYKSNTTRFLVVRKRQPTDFVDFTRQKTSLFLKFNDDRPGLLYELLRVFNQFEISLCRLESRPDKEIPWVYDFYVDFDNTEQSAHCIDALLTKPFGCTILGSYDLIP